MNEHSFIILNLYSPMKQENDFQAQFVTARRNHILDAAIKVFADKGFHRATIKDVAQAAGIADGTIYNYFENKTALLLGILDRLNETPERESHFAESAGVDLAEWTRSYLHQRFATLEPAGFQVLQALLPELFVNEELRRQYQEQIVQPTYEIAEQYVAARLGQEKGEDVALTLRLISALFLGAIVQRLLGDPVLAARWQELPDQIANLILNGIRPEA
jgi:TetR/AcrR family fatty acid metabolism transcriptional regulator